MRRLLTAAVLAATSFGTLGALATTVSTPSGQGCGIANPTSATDSCTFTISGSGFTSAYDQGVAGAYTGTARITHLFTTGGTLESGPADNLRPYQWNAATSRWEYLKTYWSGSGVGPLYGACKTCFAPYTVSFDIGIPLTLTLNGSGIVVAGALE